MLYERCMAKDHVYRDKMSCWFWLNQTFSAALRLHVLLDKPGAIKRVIKQNLDKDLVHISWPGLYDWKVVYGWNKPLWLISLKYHKAACLFSTPAGSMFFVGWGIPDKMSFLIRYSTSNKNLLVSTITCLDPCTKMQACINMQTYTSGNLLDSKHWCYYNKSILHADIQDWDYITIFYLLKRAG